MYSPFRHRLGAFIAATLLWTAISLEAQEFRIVPLVKDGQVMVTFDVGDGYTNDVRAAIKSGLKTTFTYTIDLRVPAAGWLDSTLETSVVSTSISYDNLTRRYTIVRTIDGRVQDAQVTEDDAVVKKIATSFDRVALFRTGKLEANRDYYVRVRAEVRPRSGGSMLWPWGAGRSGQAKFTFIP